MSLERPGTLLLFNIYTTTIPLHTCTTNSTQETLTPLTPLTQALASASWTLITIQNATGLPTDKGCDPSTPVINVTQACSQVVSGTLYIITYNVKLRSCNLETNVTVCVLLLMIVAEYVHIHMEDVHA